MNPNKALWEKGGFTQIASSMRQSGEAVVTSIGLVPQLLELANSRNTNENGGTSIPATFLRVTVAL